MVAYVILDISVHDDHEYENYKTLAPPAIAAYGGKYLVRGGDPANMEGDWSPSRVVILEFESTAMARRWLDSPEYHDARQLRHQSATSKAIVVDGV